MTENGKAWLVLAMNAVAFIVCFACWMINSVLITFLVSNGVYDWSSSQVGLLLATPVLTGSLMRFPAGVLTDRFGGRPVFVGVMLFTAVALLLDSFANSYFSFLVAALGFGVAGSSFAVGVGYIAAWFPQDKQGTALGLFGTGNIGTALTLLIAPTLLRHLTQAGAHMEGWRALPRIYAVALCVMAAVYWMFTYPRKNTTTKQRTFGSMLQPLRKLRVWRFGAYYALLLGGSVGLSNWLVPYYVKAYQMDLARAGFLVAMFSLPCSLSRVVGGWLSDRLGARRLMIWVLGLCCLFTLALTFPKMDLVTPGEGILSVAAGTIKTVDADTVAVARKNSERVDKYTILRRTDEHDAIDHNAGQFLPAVTKWQTWTGVRLNSEDPKSPRRPFRVGDEIGQRQLLAVGSTRISFQADVHMFTLLTVLLGITMGIGMAAVFKHIPNYFPENVGVVAGIVGVIGGVGGFVFPILWGTLLSVTGVWTSCWMVLFAVALACNLWMRNVLNRILREQAPQLAREYETR